MITPKRIYEVWLKACRSYGFDPVELDEEAKMLLHRDSFDIDGIDASIKHMNMLRDNVPGFFKEYNYEWAFDANVWRKSLEANFQARAFQQLSSLWSLPNKPNNLDFSNVVLRYTFASNVDPCTPNYITYEDISFLRMPYSFSEMVMLFTRAFSDLVKCNADVWEFTLPNDDYVSPYIKQILLRHLTDDNFHSSDPGENPADTVKRESGWFSDATKGTKKQDNLEILLSYSLIDFAIAHELGHRLLCHKHNENDYLFRDQDKEIEADRLGFTLYATSWGWRDEIIAENLLSEGARILVGPLIFHMFNEWYMTLKTAILLLKKNSNIATSAKYSTQLKSDVSENKKRFIQNMKLVNKYEQSILARGYKFSQTDRKAFTSLATSMAKFNESLVLSVQSIPGHDFHLALAAGKSQLFG